MRYLLLPLIGLMMLSSHYSESASCDDLFRDLEIVNYWDKKENDSLPIIYTHHLRAGYLNMPSARMSPEGTFAFGYSFVPPYRNYSMLAQAFPFLEISGSYRIFRGVEDSLLSPTGFGDFSDKGADFKLSLFQPEEGGSKFPGVAIGMTDFMGTRSFDSEYIVCTQVLLDYNMEWSIGYGNKRLKGLFGGIALMPWRHYKSNILKGITFVGEYDGTNYATDPHPQGRESKSPINYGIKYSLWDYLDFSVSKIRGNAIASSLSLHYNWGKTEGFMPKYKDLLPYQTPVNTEELGITRPHHSMINELVNAFSEQGLDIMRGYLSANNNKTILHLTIINDKYHLEQNVRLRLQRLLSALLPNNVDEVIVVVEAKDIPCQEYLFIGEHLQQYHNKAISDIELMILSPLREISALDKSTATLIYKDSKDLFSFTATPRFRTLFGSSTGKFKYSLGIALTATGHIADTVFYCISIGKRILANIDDTKDTDKLNPSQIINVRSDSVRYEQNNGWMLDTAFLQKNWRMGRGWYSKLSGGLFEPAYGGIGGELLYYPVNTSWAISVETARLRKREYTGTQFTKDIRRLIGWSPVYEEFKGHQYFINIYKDFQPLSVDVNVKVGQFLARDRGVMTTFTRYFRNGLRISLWYTITDAHDVINRERYHDKGIGFSMPLDVFMPNRSRKRWGDNMSAWLRDIGATASTGESLYDIIHSERN